MDQTHTDLHQTYICPVATVQFGVNELAAHFHTVGVLAQLHHLQGLTFILELPKASLVPTANLFSVKYLGQETF